jgi:holin-like protein
MNALLTILAITYFGESLSRLLSFPIPGPVIGMMTLFILLKYKIIQLEKIESLTMILLGNLAILFIPPGVKLITALDLLEGNLLKIIILMVITTILTMGATGLTVQYLINRNSRK